MASMIQVKLDLVLYHTFPKEIHYLWVAMSSYSLKNEVTSFSVAVAV